MLFHLTVENHWLNFNVRKNLLDFGFIVLNINVEHHSTKIFCEKFFLLKKFMKMKMIRDQNFDTLMLRSHCRSFIHNFLIFFLFWMSFFFKRWREISFLSISTWALTSWRPAELRAIGGMAHPGIMLPSQKF